MTSPARLAILALLTLLVTQSASAILVANIIDRSADVSKIQSACYAGATFKWSQTTIVARAEPGAYVIVSGAPDKRYDGLYRITTVDQKRGRDANYTVAFTAECVRQLTSAGKI